MPLDKGKAKLIEEPARSNPAIDLNFDNVAFDNFTITNNTDNTAGNNNEASSSTQIKNNNQNQKVTSQDKLHSSKSINTTNQRRKIKTSERQTIFKDDICNVLQETIAKCPNLSVKQSLRNALYQFRYDFDKDNYKNEYIIELLNQLTRIIHKLSADKSNTKTEKYLQNQWEEIYKIIQGYEIRASLSNKSDSFCKNDKNSDTYQVRLPEGSIRNFDFYLVNTLYIAAFMTHLFTLHVHKTEGHIESSFSGESPGESMELMEHIKEIFHTMFKKPIQELGEEELKKKLHSDDIHDKILTKIHAEDIYSCHLANVNNIELLNPYYKQSADKHCVFTVKGTVKSYGDSFKTGIDLAKTKNFNIGHDITWLNEYIKNKFTNSIATEIFSPDNKFNLTKFENFILNLIDEINKAPEKRKSIKLFQGEHVKLMHEFKSELQHILKLSDIQDDINLVLQMAKDLDKYMDATVIAKQYIELSRQLLVINTMHIIGKSLAELYEKDSVRTLRQMEQFFDKPVNELVSRELPAPPVKEFAVQKP